MNYILFFIFIFGLYNVWLHYMVLTEGRISLNHGWDVSEIRQNRFFFIYDFLFALTASLYLSTFFKGLPKIALIVYAILHAIGHGYYIIAWESKNDLVETVLKWSTVHPNQREYAMSHWWNMFNWWGTTSDLTLHLIITVLSGVFFIESVKK